jgi:hypothetical protein
VYRWKEEDVTGMVGIYEFLASCRQARDQSDPTLEAPSVDFPLEFLPVGRVGDRADKSQMGRGVGAAQDIESPDRQHLVLLRIDTPHIQEKGHILWNSPSIPEPTSVPFPKTVRIHPVWEVDHSLSRERLGGPAMFFGANTDDGLGVFQDPTGSYPPTQDLSPLHGAPGGFGPGFRLVSGDIEEPPVQGDHIRDPSAPSNGAGNSTDSLSGVEMQKVWLGTPVQVPEQTKGEHVASFLIHLGPCLRIEADVRIEIRHSAYWNSLDHALIGVCQGVGGHDLRGVASVQELFAGLQYRGFCSAPS